MPRLNYTVANLAEEVRQQLDELNRDTVSTEADILPTLNRASDFAADILTRKYPEPLLKYITLDLESGVSEYTIPEDVFEDRVLKLETVIPSGAAGRANYLELQRISYRDISNYESTSTSSFPQYYCIIGRKIRIVPQPSGSYDARMWIIRNPEKLVLPQGRVTKINSSPTTNYIIVDEADGNLTTQSDQLASYVNVIDGQTGEIRGSLQIQAIVDNKITFRTSPVRSTVLNREINTSLQDIQIQEDDYICAIDGICVPYFGRPTSNFLIQYAVAEITRKLGGSAEAEEAILKKFEQQVERTWAGRQQDLRIKKKSNIWGNNNRRFWWYWSQ
jgi:hypothetical protein